MIANQPEHEQAEPVLAAGAPSTATDAEQTVTTQPHPGRLRNLLLGGLLLLAAAAIVNASITSEQGLFFLTERFQTFVTIFLGIFIEAVPFLLAGSIVSGFIAVYVSQEMLERYVPRQPVLASLAGASMGLLFPVCECGVVPVTRRLYEKGLPVSVGIAFLLAAPVINPVVIISTYAAFGWGPILLGRVCFSLLIAFVVGLLFQTARAGEVLLPSTQNIHAHNHAAHGGAAHNDAAHGDHSHAAPHTVTHTVTHAPAQRSVWGAFNTAGDDFIDMARYLILGSMMAAAMQTLVPREALLAVGEGPVISVIAMQVLAFVLSVCSTVDAFLALAFAGTFSTGSILAFLTFGPMVDIKSSLMFLGVFRRRIVLYLVLLPFLLSLLIGVFWNLNIG